VKTLYLKHEGENPTGIVSKDRGMTGGLDPGPPCPWYESASPAASTGNTSSSLAAIRSLERPAREFLSLFQDFAQSR